MIYITHKMLLLPKDYLTYLKDNIFEWFFKKYNRLSFLKKNFFFMTYNDGKSKTWRRNLFRLKKELNYSAIKDIRNLFRLEKETKAINDRMLRDIKNIFEYKQGENITNQLE